MFFQKKTSPLNSRLKRRSEAATPKTAGVVREAWWLALVAVGVYLTVILFSYHHDDPSWSHSASDNAIIHNMGGKAGAWLADVLRYQIGFSAWWWVVVAFYAIRLIY